MTISNPRSGNALTSDFRTGKADNGVEHNYGKDVRLYRADAAVTKGQIVNFVAPTETKPLSVTPASSVTNLTAGVAEASVAEGELVRVCVEGNTFVILGGTVTAGAVLGGGSSAKATAITPGAGILSGATLGFALVGGDENDVVPAYVKHQ